MSGHAIDVGGYLGSVGISLAVDHPNLHVTIIEPVPENVALIRENIALNGVSARVSVIQAAAGDGTPQRIHYGFRGDEVGEHHAFVGNGTLSMQGTECPDVDHDHVDSAGVSLDDLPFADFLKIDCEGCEGNVLATQAAREIPLIVGEYHPNVGQAGIKKLLGKTHRIKFAKDAGGAGEFTAVMR